MSGVLVVGANALAAELVAIAGRAAVAERTISAHYGAVYQTRVRARMSGRPGLRAITGEGRRRVTLDVRRGPAGTVVEVYTTWAAARRHEFGWNGIDSLGRHIPTPPRPAWEPDLQRTVDEYHAAMAAAVLAS